MPLGKFEELEEHFTNAPSIQTYFAELLKRNERNRPKTVGCEILSLVRVGQLSKPVYILLPIILRIINICTYNVRIIWQVTRFSSFEKMRY